MPLRASGPDDFSDDNMLVGIRFGMFDGPRRIVCVVTYEALVDRAAADGSREDITDTFLRHRPQIEAIASRIFDEGDISPRVLSEYLTP